jgi:hypothetical protein
VTIDNFDLETHDLVALQLLCAVLRPEDLRVSLRDFENDQRRERVAELLAGAHELAATFLAEAEPDPDEPVGRLSPCAEELFAARRQGAELEQAVRAFLTPAVRQAVKDLIAKDELDPSVVRRLAVALDPNDAAKALMSGMVARFIGQEGSK